MAWIETILATKTITIDTNLANKECYFATADATDDDVYNIANASAVCFPISECADGSTTATKGTIVLAGVAKLKLGGTVAQGARIAADSAGKGVAAAAAAAFSAIALAGGVDGDIIPVLISHGTVAA